MIQRQGATSSTENALEVIASTDWLNILYSLLLHTMETLLGQQADYYRLTDYRITSLPTAIQNASQKCILN